MRYRRKIEPKQRKSWPYIGIGAAVAGGPAVGIAAAAWKTGYETGAIESLRRDIRIVEGYNAVSTETGQLCSTLFSELTRGEGSVDSINGRELGTCQWTVVRGAMREGHDLFRSEEWGMWRRTVDRTEKRYNVLKRLKGDHRTQPALGALRRLDGEVAALSKRDREDAVEYLEAKIHNQIIIEDLKVQVAAREENRPKAVVNYGIGFGLVLEAPVILISLSIMIKRALRRFRQKLADVTRRSQPLEVESKSTDGIAPKVAQTPGRVRKYRKVEKRNEDRQRPVRARKKRDVDAEKQQLATVAKAELIHVLSEEQIDAIFRILNGKLSIRILNELIGGEYASFYRLVNTSRKQLQIQGIDAEDIISRLKEETTKSVDLQEAEPEDKKRRRHELDDVGRWGWRSGAFFTMLRNHGFEIGKLTGGGHYMIKYGGVPLRKPDGRFVLVTHRISGTEITPGTAGNVLKFCAVFLVALEDGKADENDRPVRKGNGSPNGS